MPPRSTKRRPASSKDSDSSSSKKRKSDKSTMDRLAVLETAFLAINTGQLWVCSGSVPLTTPEVRDLTVYFRSDTDSTKISSIGLPITPEVGATALTLGTPSPDGEEKKLVENAHVEYKPPAFGFSADPILTTGILGHIRKYMMLKPELVARPTRLDVYTSGGSSPKIGNPSKQKYVGRIALCLPSQFSGGEMTIRGKGEERTYPWTYSREGTALEWCFLLPDCELEVRPVTDGHLMTVTYDIFEAPPAPDAPSTKEDPKLVALLRSLLDDKEFLPKGGVLAFALQQEYDNGSVYDAVLRDADATWAASLKAAGLEPRIAFVWENDEYYESAVEEREEDSSILENRAKRMQGERFKDREWPWGFNALNGKGGDWVCSPDDYIFELARKERQYDGVPTDWITAPRVWGAYDDYMRNFGIEGSNAISHQRNLVLVTLVPPHNKRSHTSPHTRSKLKKKM